MVPPEMSECFNVFEMNLGPFILSSHKLLFLLLSIILPLFQTYRDFHQDVFPDTFTGDASMTAEEWFAGQNKPVSKKRPQETQDSLRYAHFDNDRGFTLGGVLILEGFLIYCQIHEDIQVPTSIH